MLALGLLTLVPVLMWLGQSVLLVYSGMPLRLRISSGGLPKSLKQANRVIANGSFLTVLLVYPLVLGDRPIAYYAGFLPFGSRPLEFVHGLTVSVLFLGLLYLGWLATDNIRVRVRHGLGTIARRLALVPVMAIFGAAVEELLFRAVLLAGLLKSFEPPTAVIVGSLVFAGAHYVRRVKRYWTFVGHLALGLLLCVAFVTTGTLWLPMGLHAGGILVIMGLRPFLRYNGPEWLVGASVFPYAGLPGIAALVLLTIGVWRQYGGAP
jgi:membrane protease YdiL (CAAX protease family)